MQVRDFSSVTYELSLAEIQRESGTINSVFMINIFFQNNKRVAMSYNMLTAVCRLHIPSRLNGHVLWCCFTTIKINVHALFEIKTFSYAMPHLNS